MRGDGKDTKHNKANLSLTLRFVSQDPVQRASPLLFTPKHDTLFSWGVGNAYADSDESASVSQTYVLKSSYPPNINLPDLLNATDVIPHVILSLLNLFTSP